MNLIHKLFYRFSWFREIKWAYQRLVRGWDDRVLWNVDGYLAEMIPIWLSELKKSNSCPVILGKKAPEVDWTDQDWCENKEEWDKVVDKIIIGFNAATDLIDSNSHAWDTYFEEYKIRYGEYDIMKSEKEKDELLKELDTLNQSVIEEKELLIKFDEGMDLFKKHFFNFWS